MTELRRLLLSTFRKLLSPISGKHLGKLPLLTSFQSFFYGQLKPTAVVLIDVQGSKMYVDPKDTGVAPYLLQWGVYEKHETALFKKLIKKGMIVIDVGANIGYYTLLAASLVGERGQVFAFEPDPHNFELLCKNVALNGYRNTVVPVQKAVSRKPGKAKLFLDKTNLGNHSLSETNVDKDNFVMVEVTSLDDFFKNTNCKVDIVKMDIQGSEMEALEGMTNTINKNEDLMILTEFWPAGLRNAGSPAEAFLDKLMECGFALFQVGQRLEPINVSRLLKTFTEKEPATLLCKRPGALEDQ